MDLVGLTIFSKLVLDRLKFGSLFGTSRHAARKHKVCNPGFALQLIGCEFDAILVDQLEFGSAAVHLQRATGVCVSGIFCELIWNWLKTAVILIYNDQDNCQGDDQNNGQANPFPAATRDLILGLRAW